jgi:hypothetical protein
MALVREALRGMQSRYARQTIAVPGTPTSAIAIGLDYRALADLNIALGLDRMVDAVARTSADAQTHATLVSQGVQELMSSRRLITRDGVPFANGMLALDLTPGRLALQFTAHGTDAMPPMPNTHTTGDPQNASGLALADVSVPFMRNWHLPGDTAGHRITTSEFDRMLTDAAGLGTLLATPHALALLMRSLLESSTRTSAAFDPATTTFERIGVDLTQIDPEPRGVMLGLLPVGATPESAACALAATPADCATTRLQMGASTPVQGGGIARLANVGGRLVVFGAMNASALDGTMPLVIAPVDAPTATAWMDFSRAIPPEQAAQLPPDFHEVTATADVVGRDVSVTIVQGGGRASAMR